MHTMEGWTLFLEGSRTKCAACLNFEDAMDSLRLKADAIKGTLDKSELKSK